MHADLGWDIIGIVEIIQETAFNVMQRLYFNETILIVPDCTVSAERILAGNNRKHKAEEFVVEILSDKITPPKPA